MRSDWNIKNNIFILFKNARITRIGGKMVCHYFGKYSQTTTRHQKEFFKQNGLSDKEIKYLFKNGTLEV